MRLGDVRAAVLAGGLGTRLGAAATDRPKAMIEVGGRPFVDQQVDLLRRRGLRQVVFCVGHLGDQIETHLGDGGERGMAFHYSHDGPRLLGTGGALRRAISMLGEVFFVIYGDSYMDIDYGAVLDDFLKRRPLGLMTLLRNEGRGDRSNAVFRDGCFVRYDKRNPTLEMDYIDYGVSLLRSEVLLRVPEGEPSDVGDLFARLVAEGSMLGHEVAEPFYEIGTPQGLAAARAFLGAQKARV